MKYSSACKVGLMAFLSLGVVVSTAHAASESHHDEWFLEGGVGASRVSSDKPAEVQEARRDGSAAQAKKETVQNEKNRGYGKDSAPCACAESQGASQHDDACPHHRHAK